MSELKRTVLYDTHVAAGASTVDFGGWEMPMQYPGGIVAEHLYTRRFCSLFDVSHMGRLLIEGPQRVDFLQHVLTSNVAALPCGKAQYAIIPNEQGGAIDDAYLYRFEEDRLLLVVNAANKEKDLAYLMEAIQGFSCTLRDVSEITASIAVQGPQSQAMLCQLDGTDAIAALPKNGLYATSFAGHPVWVARTGYTGEPLGYEIYLQNADAGWLWNRLEALDARPAGLGARDTLRLEACLPLYGHEMGLDAEGKEIPIFAVPLSRFAVSFVPEKGDFVGRAALSAQAEVAAKRRDDPRGAGAPSEILPKRIVPVALLDRGVMRAGMPVYRGETCIGWVTSGTMVPYYPCLCAGPAEGGAADAPAKRACGGAEAADAWSSAKRALGMAYLSADVAAGDVVEVDVRGKRLRAAVTTCHMKNRTVPYAQPVLCEDGER